MPASTTANTLEQLEGLFKVVYAEGFENLIPEFTQVQAAVQFRRTNKVGLNYRQPVVLGMEQGITSFGGGTGNTMEAFSLVAPVQGQRREATVFGSETLLRSSIAYKAAFSAPRGGKTAFRNATYDLFQNMWQSIRRRTEIHCLYGQKPAGVVSAHSSKVITFTTASWAPGIWAGMEGAHIQVKQTGANAFRLANAVADTDYGVYYTIDTIDLDARTITLDQDATDVVATDEVYFRTEAIPSTITYRTMHGIDSIITNATTLFGIDAATYNLWKGTTISAGSSQLTMEMLLEAAAKVQSKGMVSEFTVWLNPLGWRDLNADQAALRRYDSTYKDGAIVSGAKSLKFHTQNGTMVVKSHPCVKEGDAFGVPTKLWRRIGATDVTFKRPAMEGIDAGGSFFRELNDNAGYEIRCYGDQAIFTARPGLCFKINNIVNS